ncbi:right-handed parallel beta-helix repeat-containing protein [Streptomyces nigrescens]
MSTPTETYPLPDAIPTVKVTGMYRGPDGRGLVGTVTFTGPPLLTFAESDLFIGGSVAVKLDPFGQFEVTLPATDAPDMNPTGWAYAVKENLTNVTGARTFSMVLPADTPGGVIDLADVAPSDPSEYTYVPVAGDSAYEIAVANGFVGTEGQWLTSLVGTPGTPGAPGVVQSVNGISAATVVLTAGHVGAIPLADKGVASGVATLDGSGKVPTSQLPAMSGGMDAGTLNVRTYGATGNGTTNDAPAIQAALNAALAAGGGWVVVPPGTYACATLPLRVYRNTRLTLMPGARFKRTGNNTFLLNGDAAQTYGGYTGHGNIVIEGGTWDMRATAYPTNPDMCISIGHCRDITIRDIELLDLAGYHGIELNSTKHALISNCSFRGYVDTGGRDFSEAVQIDLAGRPSLFGGFGPYDGTPCEDITMRDCYVGPSGTAGTVAWPSGVGSHSATWGKWHRRIRIINNTFEGGAQYTVKPYIWEESVVSGNTMRDCGAGIWLRTLDSTKSADRTDMNGVDQNASQNGYNFVISDNVIRNNGSFNDAIFIQGESTGKWLGVVVTGNNINGVTGSENGVRMEYVERFTLANNVIQSVGGTALSTSKCYSGNIQGNRMMTCGGSWITNDGGSFLTIQGNNASDCNSHGVWSFGGADVVISGNYLRGAGRTDATANGIRLSTAGSDRIMVAGNQYRKWGSGTEATTVFSTSSAVTALRRYGNTWDGGTISDAATGSLYSPYDVDKQPA